MLRVKMELTQPVQDADGNVVYQPGALFDILDPFLGGLPPGHVRPVIVEESEPDTVPEPSPLAERGIVELRAQAKALGVTVDGRWSAARLQQEISNAKSKETA